MKSRPHQVAPRRRTVRLIIAYKNFAANKGISHIGLGVTAMTNAKVLTKAGVWVEVWPILSAADLRRRLELARAEAHHRHEVPPSHVVVSAPWIGTHELSALVHHFTDTQFAVVSHSNVGFLQADANGMRLLREYAHLEQATHNFRVAGNCQKFVRWFTAAYHVAAAYLPNLYPIEPRPRHPKTWQHNGVLRIGAFGAIRPLKNHMTAAAAAIAIANRLHADVELHMSAGRTEGGGDTVMRAIRAMTAGLPNLVLKEVGWATWPEFRAKVSHMHLLLNLSYSESHNMVCADGIHEGVPSVVSEAIDWVPPNWTASFDDANDVADRAVALLHDPFAARHGLECLDTHNRQGVLAWERYLGLLETDR
jgi:hypothetical protein